MGPSLPVYMISIERIFEGSESPDVIPVESPTVPKALTISKNESLNETPGSKTDKR